MKMTNDFLAIESGNKICADTSDPRREMMNKREFEESYARRSKMTVKSLRKWRRVYPCSCGDQMCEGWQSMNPILYWEDRLLHERKWWMRIMLLIWKVRGLAGRGQSGD